MPDSRKEGRSGSMVVLPLMGFGLMAQVSAMLFAEMNQETGEMTQNKKPWEPMKLSYSGDAGDIIKNQGGEGKSSTSADSGDIHKPPGQG